MTVQEVKRQGIPRLLEIAGEGRNLLVCSALLSTLSSLLQLVPFVSVYFILEEALLRRGNVASMRPDIVLYWAKAAGISMVVSLVLTYAGGMCSHIAAFRILYRLRVRLAEHIGRLPLGYLSANATGAVKKVLETNVEKIEHFVAHGIPDCVRSLAMTVFMGLGLLAVDWRIALAGLLPLLVAWLLMARMGGGRRARDYARQYQDALERMSASAVQFIRGMPAIKAFGQTIRSFRSFHADILKYRDFAVMLTHVWQNGYVGMQVVLASVAAFILPVGLLLLKGYGAPDRAASFTLTLLLCLIVTPGITAPFTSAMTVALSMGQITEGVSRIDAIFAVRPLPEVLGETSEPPATLDLSFENVFFTYDEHTPPGEAADTYALRDVSFTARAGTITALVGPSGSGKSTVAHLIPRFWEVSSGTIRVGGRDIREMPTPELMGCVSFVFQDTFLFYDTILENIRVGRADATTEEVERAARAARCHEFIECLPQGYGTRIGAGGVRLSGGEEQRISVARAILKDSPILVLDEATAFADPENEHQMHLALAELMRGKTVIVIAHRLASIRNADQILVFEGGAVAERGLHEELLVKGGTYRRMWEVYSESEVWTL